MLVSTAVMLSLHFAIHGFSNLLVRHAGHSRPLEHARDFAQRGPWKAANGTQQYSFGSRFDGELRARCPRSGGTKFLGQYDLAFGGESGGFQG